MHTRRIFGGAAAVLCVAGAAQAQYTTDFEGVNASSGGTVLTGQDGYYLPNTVSVDFKAYTYAGNALGIPSNPNGGAQFIGGTGPGGTTFARAQRNVAGFDSAVHVFEYDLLVSNDGVTPGSNNLGSFSLQPHDSLPTHKTMIVLASYANVNDITAWQLGYIVYDAAGVEALQPGNFAGDAWKGLKVKNWYHITTTVDFSTNAITEVSIQDITGGGNKITANPVGWFVRGGQNSPFPTPTGIRFFGGGSLANNSTCWDNFNGAHPEEDCYADCDGSGELDVDDFICYQTLFGLGDLGADCDGSGELDVDDFICYQTAFGIGCG